MPKSRPPISTPLTDLLKWLAPRVEWLRKWHLGPEDPKPIPDAFRDDIVATCRADILTAFAAVPTDPEALRRLANELILRYSQLSLNETYSRLEAIGIVDTPILPPLDPVADYQYLITSLAHLTTLRSFVAEQITQRKPPSGTMTLTEANEKALKLAKRKRSFVRGSQRDWADAIGCSPALVAKLPLWQKTMKRTGRGKKGKAATPKAVSLTPELEAATRKHEGRELDQLQRLIAEQEADQELSPLDDDYPDPKPRKTKSKKRV